MSASQGWALQQAVYARLAAQLAGQGPGGADVPVYDHGPADPPRVHVRIDGFGIAQRRVKCDATRHFFTVHAFDRPTDESAAARGQKTARLVQQAAIAALHQWRPAVTGAGAVDHVESDIAPDEDGLTQHAISRFDVYISG